MVDADPISQTDTDGADIVIQIAGELRSQGIWLAFAHLNSSILELWSRAGAIDAIGPDHVFQTDRAAVRAFGADVSASLAGDDDGRHRPSPNALADACFISSG